MKKLVKHCEEARTAEDTAREAENTFRASKHAWSQRKSRRKDSKKWQRKCGKSPKVTTQRV